MRRKLLAVVAAILTFAALLFLLPTLFSLSEFGGPQSFKRYGLSFLTLAALASAAWYAASLGGSDRWPRG